MVLGTPGLVGPARGLRKSHRDWRRAAMEGRQIESRLAPRMKTFGYHPRAVIDRRIVPPSRALFRGARGTTRPISDNASYWQWWNAQMAGAGRRLGILSPSMTGADPQLTVKQIRNFAKAAIETTDTGAINPIYSFILASQVPGDDQVNRALKHIGWVIQGFRFKSAAAISSGVGIAENQALGTGVKSTFKEVAPDPNEIEAVYDMSVRFNVLQAISDGVTWQQVQDEAAIEFMSAWDTDALADAGTAKGNNVTSWDKLLAAQVLETGASYSGGDADVYGYDRSVATGDTDFDSNLNWNVEVLRNFNPFLVDEMWSEQEAYWRGVGGDPGNTWMATGRDTYERWSNYESAKERIKIANASVTLGNGLQYTGTPSGFKMGTWRERPIVRDDNVVQDTLRRVLAFHNDFAWIAEGLPLVTITAGEDPEDMTSVGHTLKNVLYGINENYLHTPRACGSLRDLK